MLRAHISTPLVRILVPSIIVQILIPISAMAGPMLPHFVLSGSGLIAQKQPVPDDPLAGLPTEDGGGRERGRGRSGASSRACALKANVANERDIGDLRATLAFVQFGPKFWPCPGRADQSNLRIRVSIDGTGKVTTVELAAGDASFASAMAKRLAGRSIAPRPEGATVGIVVLTFAPSKRH